MDDLLEKLRRATFSRLQQKAAQIASSPTLNRAARAVSLPEYTPSQRRVHQAVKQFALEAGLNIEGAAPGPIIAGGVKTIFNARQMRKMLPEIRSVKSMLETSPKLGFKQFKAIDDVVRRIQPTIKKSLSKVISDPNEYEKFVYKLLKDAEYAALNPKLRIGLGTRELGQEVGKPQRIRVKQPSPLTDIAEEPLRIKPRSIAQEASQRLSREGAGKSLPDIIDKKSINVKEKVGILDYIRTPDRVLKKIGLGKEARLLRDKYNDYLTQIPQEINKITQWSKKVPKESNQRIFRYLDGQDIKLADKELKVAKEIQAYLADWADKLKLPKDKRIANYITHIFEKDFIKKEFDPELAKLIQDKVAGSVYDPFLQKRLGKLGYVEDTWRALDAYVKRATRKFHMDQALDQVKKASKNLETSQYNYVREYVDRINLRPTQVDSLVDNTVKQIAGYRFGQRPVANLTRKARQMVYRGTLGLNPGTALKNLTQGANTYAKLGEKWTVKGYWDLLTKGTRELEDVGILRNNFIEDRTLSAGKQLTQKIDRGLFTFFDGAEKINRGSAYYGAKAKALKEGLSEEQAIRKGIDMVRDTQFTFGSVDTPLVLQSDINKLLLQFQSFTIKQGEFLGEMIKNKEFAGLLRYSLAGALVVSTVGKAIGMDAKDMIPSFRIGVPPTLQFPVEAGKAIAGAPDKYGNIPDVEQKLKNVGRSLIPFMPGGTQGRKTIQGLQATEQGYSETPSGRVRFPVSTDPVSRVKGALFGQYNFPEARRYYDEDLSPLGEKQSEIFKKLEEPREFYENILRKRKISKKEKEEKGVLAAGPSEADTKLKVEISALDGKESTLFSDNDKYYRYDFDKENVKVIDYSDAMKTAKTKYEKAKLEEERFQTALKFYRDDDIPEGDKKQLYAKVGVPENELQYYEVASDKADLKTEYVEEGLAGMRDREEILRYLIEGRRIIGGKIMVSDGVLDNLYNDGIITKEERTAIKKFKIDQDGEVKVKMSGRGKTARFKKAKFVPLKFRKTGINIPQNIGKMEGVVPNINFNIPKLQVQVPNIPNIPVKFNI
jgi:hypothetical protein